MQFYGSTCSLGLTYLIGGLAWISYNAREKRCWVLECQLKYVVYCKLHVLVFFKNHCLEATISIAYLPLPPRSRSGRIYSLRKQR